MALSEEQLKLIEKWLSGQISEEEVTQLNAMRSDPDFMTELNFRQDLKEAVRSLERQELRQVLQKTEQEMPDPVRSKRLRTTPRILIWVSAAVILLLIGFILFVPKATSLSGSALFTEFYEPFPNTVSPVTKGDPVDLNGYEAYELKMYDRAIKLLAPQVQNDTAAFYLALSYLGKQQSAEAEIMLKSLIERDGAYDIPAEWYFALLLVEESRFDEAQNLLNRIGLSDHPLATRAKLLLSKLNGDNNRN